MPKTGEIIVWKACRSLLTDRFTHASKYVNVYVKLKIAEATQRVTPLIDKFTETIKGRVERAIVLEITDKDGNHYNSAESFVHTPQKLEYVVNMKVASNWYDDSHGVQCGEGINVHLHKDQCDYWFENY